MITTIKTLLAPASFSLLGMALLVGVALRRVKQGRYRQLGHWWNGIWLLVYILLSTPTVSEALLASLAHPYSAISTASQGAEAGAIVVLTGGANFHDFGNQRLAVASHSTTLRATEAARVYHLLTNRPLIASGTRDVRRGAKSADALALGAALTTLGVPSAQLVFEMRSMDTHESAIEVAKWCDERGIRKVVLVTSAYHMMRSIAVYRASGIEAIPAPAPVGVPRARGWARVIPNAASLNLSAVCLHEYVGFAYYWFRGWM